MEPTDPFFSKPDILNGILNLANDGVIRSTYTSRFEVGFEPV
jgi:hypothetical protein